MMISTRGRYALRVMIDLGQHDPKDFLPLCDIAKRQNISEKYLESIVAVLVKNGFLEAQRGKCGGYRLSRMPEEYTVAQVLSLTEKTLAPVACVEDGSVPCDRAGGCPTKEMWAGLYRLIREYFSGIKLSDLTGPPKNG